MSRVWTDQFRAEEEARERDDAMADLEARRNAEWEADYAAKCVEDAARALEAQFEEAEDRV